MWMDGHRSHVSLWIDDRWPCMIQTHHRLFPREQLAWCTGKFVNPENGDGLKPLRDAKSVISEEAADMLCIQAMLDWLYNHQDISPPKTPLIQGLESAGIKGLPFCMAAA